MSSVKKSAKVHGTDPFLKAVKAGEVVLASSLSEMFNRSFAAKTNVICFRRELQGDFNAVAAFFKKELGNQNASFTQAEFEDYAKEMKGDTAIAAQAIGADFRSMVESGCRNVVLRVVTDEGYDENNSLTECVHLFHVDGGHRAKGRVLTCYTVATTEGLMQKDAVCMSDLEDFDAYCEKLYQDQHGFDGDIDRYMDFLYAQKEGHYVPLEGKEPFSFKLGDIWRQATENNKDRVCPLIHRAPRIPKGSLPRLLMVGDY